MADKISVLGLALDGEVGVYDHERGVQQRLIIDLEIMVDRAGADDLTATVDYDQVTEIAKEVVSAQHHHLIETIADAIADRALALPRVKSVTVRVQKPGAIPDARTVQIEVARTRSNGL